VKSPNYETFRVRHIIKLKYNVPSRINIQFPVTQPEGKYSQKVLLEGINHAISKGKDKTQTVL
jgi:hypothetical protein